MCRRWSQYPGDAVSFTVTGDASLLTTTSSLTDTHVKYGSEPTQCVYDYVNIPGGSEDGNMLTSRDR